MDGSGIYRWKNGDMYEGTFKNGMRNGFGTMAYSDGERYSGQWKSNKQSGTGEWHSVEGDKMSGIWEGTNLLVPYTDQQLGITIYLSIYLSLSDIDILR